MSHETRTIETDLDALQSDYNRAVDSKQLEGQEDTFAEYAAECGTTVGALESARRERQIEAASRTAELVKKRLKDGTITDPNETLDYWPINEEDKD